MKIKVAIDSIKPDLENVHRSALAPESLPILASMDRHELFDKVSLKYMTRTTFFAMTCV